MTAVVEAAALRTDFPTPREGVVEPRRFARFTAKIVPASSGCWLWAASKNAAGYGYFGFDGKLGYAHHLAYRLWVDEIPDGLFVLHECDVPSCVNPAHLHVGTHAANMRERAERGRTARGTRTRRARLTESDVVELRRLVASGVALSALGTRHGVSKQCIHKAVRGETWAHVPCGLRLVSDDEGRRVSPPLHAPVLTPTGGAAC